MNRPRRPLTERLRDLVAGKPTVRLRLVVPKRAGGGEQCAVCHARMIAGSGYLHARLVCGPCKKHGLLPAVRADDGPDCAA